MRLNQPLALMFAVIASMPSMACRSAVTSKVYTSPPVVADASTTLSPPSTTTTTFPAPTTSLPSSSKCGSQLGPAEMTGTILYTGGGVAGGIFVTFQPTSCESEPLQMAGREYVRNGTEVIVTGRWVIASNGRHPDFIEESTRRA
jgi:hypothetical protein